MMVCQECFGAIPALATAQVMVVTGAVPACHGCSALNWHGMSERKRAREGGLGVVVCCCGLSCLFVTSDEAKSQRFRGLAITGQSCS